MTMTNKKLAGFILKIEILVSNIIIKMLKIINTSSNENSYKGVFHSYKDFIKKKKEKKKL